MSAHGASRGAAAALWTGGAVAVVSMAAHFRAPLLPDMGAELAMTPAALGLLTTVFGVGRLLADIPAGATVDRMGPRAGFAVSGACIALGGVLFAAAPAAAWALAGAFVVGAGSAVANTTGMTFFSTSAGASRRGRALAGYSAALLGGQALGPAVAGGLALLGGWRVAMAATVAIGLVVAVASARPGARRAAPARAAAGRRTPARAADQPAGRGGLSGVQRWCLYGVSFTSMFVIAAMPQTLVPIIGGGFGLRADVIGLALGLGGVLRIIGAFVGGPMSDRHGRKVVLVPGLAVQGVGVGLLMITGSVLAWLAAIAIMSLASYGVGTAAAMLGDRTPTGRAGRELGRYRFVGDVGVIVGPLLAASLFEVVGQAAAAGVVSVLLLGTAAATGLLLPETFAGAKAEGTAR
jgi:MFS transporter, DHA1 family, multidrug resistance protein